MVWYRGNSTGNVDRVDFINGIRVLRASRKPCPVCGSSSGDCVSHSDRPESEKHQISVNFSEPEQEN